MRFKVPTVCAYETPSNTALLVDPGALVGTSLLKVMLPLSVRVLPLPEESIAGFAASTFQSATVAARKAGSAKQRIVTPAASMAHDFLNRLRAEGRIAA